MWMMNLGERKSVPLLLLVAFLFLMVGIWGTFRLANQPGMGAVLERSEGRLRIRQIEAVWKAQEAGPMPGDLLLEVDGKAVRSKADLNFHIQQKKIGEPVVLTLQRAGEKVVTTMPVVGEYGWFFLVINFLAALFVWVMGVFVFLKKPEGQVVRIYLFSSLSLSLALFVPRAGYPLGPREVSFILPSFQIIAYTLLPALFFHFSVIFPREEKVSARRKPVIYSGYLPGLALIALMEVFYWKAISSDSANIFRTYATLFLVFRIYLVAYVLLGLYALYQTYKRSEFLEEKRKIRWIFWGIAVGTFPFLFLHTLPDVLLGYTLAPEAIKSLFVLLIPVSFAFSILKYQAMNIDVVINRSLVYSLLTAFILGIYLIVAGVLGSMLYTLTGYEGSLFPILATLVAAVLFTPARNRIRALVDKIFYRVRYDYRKAIKEFTGEVELAFTQDELLLLLLKKIDDLLAVNRALVFLRRAESEEFEIHRSIGFSQRELEELARQKDTLLPGLCKSKAIRGSVGATAFEEFPVLPEDRTLKKFEIQLSFPMMEKEELLGLLVLGAKKSEIRYSAEDVELVSLMVQEVARAIQNLRMRQRIVAEQLEREKAEELNKMKTKFISNVSHDLRTPLTAIRFSLDNMLKGVYGPVPEENRKHLQMIQDSTLHVSRTIDNLLTLCMSESGRIVLNKERLPLAGVVDEACGMMGTLAQKKGIALEQENLKGLCVHADKHSLLEVLLNLLDNAIKYTQQGGRVSVSAKSVDGEQFVEISVTDDGVGIRPENLEKIFERFHMATPGGTVGEKGTGIGLDIVRNLVGLHGGEVKVESPVPETQEGTRFSFTLPRG